LWGECNPLDITDLIDGLVSSADVEQAKPNPDVFKTALEKVDEDFAPKR
jgi:beta-phosphoglucomutase-like phosphatase (HAD superfamily)